MEELNRSLFLAINASAEASLPMRELAIFLAQWVVLCVPLLLLVLWVFGERRQKMIVLLATCTLDERAAMYAGQTAVQPEDVAAMVMAVHAMPQHVNVSRFDILPTRQPVMAQVAAAGGKK
mgnify:CR=1 FL=1